MSHRTFALLGAFAVLLLVIGALSAALAHNSSSTVEVKVNARQLSDGRVEFAIQHREGSGWSDRILSSSRYFPASISHDRWVSSSAFTFSLGAPDNDGDMMEEEVVPATSATKAPSPLVPVTSATAPLLPRGCRIFLQGMTEVLPQWKQSTQGVHDSAHELSGSDLWTGQVGTTIDHDTALAFHRVFAGVADWQQHKLHLFDDLILGAQNCISEERTGVAPTPTYKAIDLHHHQMWSQISWPSAAGGSAQRTVSGPPDPSVIEWWRIHNPGEFGEKHHEGWQVWRMGGAGQLHLHAACQKGNADLHVKHPTGDWEQATLHRVMIYADTLVGDISRTHLIKSMTDQIMDRCGLDDDHEPIWDGLQRAALEGGGQPTQGSSPVQGASASTTQRQSAEASIGTLGGRATRRSIARRRSTTGR